MAASRDDISGWFDQGKRAGNTHMIVVCDTFDHEDYPVYAKGDEQARSQHDRHNGKNMQRVMEVYDLRLPKTVQLDEHRAMHLP